jgi:hypothetical protein
MGACHKCLKNESKCAATMGFGSGVKAKPLHQARSVVGRGIEGRVIRSAMHPERSWSLDGAKVLRQDPTSTGTSWGEGGAEDHRVNNPNRGASRKELGL